MLDSSDLLQYTEPVQTDLELFDRKLNDYLRGDSPLITSLARHLLKSKGKRIRPAFLFLTSRAAGCFTEHSVDASLAVELAAPGVNINSTVPATGHPDIADPSGYNHLNGTSMACPHVSGTAALVIAAGIGDVRNQLRATALKYSDQY